MSFDLNEKIGLIKNETLENLRDSYYVENLIMKIGIFGGKPNQIPEFLKPFFGGLNLWQNPNQLAKFLVLLSNYRIRSYAEIGAYFGGTFITICEYLKRFNFDFQKAYAIDPNSYYVGSDMANKKSLLDEYIIYNSDINRKIADAVKAMKEDHIDFVFIDGNHDIKNVLEDFENARKLNAKIIAIHDINSVCDDSWKKIIKDYSKDYDAKEIRDIYSDKYNYFGFGIMIKKGKEVKSWERYCFFVLYFYFLWIT